MEKPKLWAHQQQAVVQALGQASYFLAFDPGTGKSRTAIEILRHRYNDKKRILRTLIVTPLITVHNWKNEWLKFSPIEPHKVMVLEGSAVQRTQKFMKEAYDDEGNELGKVFICNYESLLMKDLFEAFKYWGIECLIVDESHRAKNPSANRTKRLIELKDDMVKQDLLGKTTHTLLLSGTPVLNSQMDLFSQFRILDGGATFGKNFFGFRAQYFYDKNAHMPKQKHFPDWRVKPSSDELIKGLISKLSMSVKKEECLTLPPLIRQVIDVELSKEQRKAYDEMKKDFITFINDKACVAQLAITKALRLQQIVSGHLKAEDGTVIKFEDIPRTKALSELLSDILPNKVIVWSVWREDYERIRAVARDLKAKCVEITGETPNAEKFKNMEAFNNDPDLSILIANPGAGGIGINLVSASYSIWFSRNFSLEQDLQANARNHRGGSEIHQKITRYDLVTKGTIDELILESVKNKQNLAEKIMDLKNL